MKTAISIPDKLFAEAEREAKRRGVSRSKLYQEALMRGRGRKLNVLVRVNPNDPHSRKPRTGAKRRRGYPGSSQASFW